jgi:ligand-binding sensor protein
MRRITLVLLVLLVGCGSQNDAGDGATSFSAAQKVLDGVAAQHANLKRLTLHAVPAGKTECTQIASTRADRRGRPSDPEDLEALRTGKEVILDEAGAIDVTVPILVADGKAAAVTGVTLTLKDGADRDSLLNEAHAIAKELEKAIQSAAKPLW